ncbi:MAG: transcription-repair coupling factor [Gammaproteobacteria bacterium]|jgi:transcription-repair coupling factor (superfamily II helicase)|nr:transcription-repair coupling factor [Gammaproteobacteria bacterium]
MNDAPITRPPLPNREKPRIEWGRLYGCSAGLAIAGALRQHKGVVLIVTPDMSSASRLEHEIRFFNRAIADDVLLFPDWETLPYDVFSPHEDIISRRLETLSRLPSLRRGVIIVPAITLMQRLAPRGWLEQSSLVLSVGENLDRDALRRRLEEAGNVCVSQVMSHGEYAVRGSIIDIFPMGGDRPFRIDLLDEEIESIRIFDPERQTSIRKTDHIRMLPAREFPTGEEGIKRFRRNHRSEFEGDPTRSRIYTDVSANVMPPGIEYYLPLFFEETGTLFDYLPERTLLIRDVEVGAAAEGIERDCLDRYESRRHDRERPLLPPERLFLSADELAQAMAPLPTVVLHCLEIAPGASIRACNFPVQRLPTLALNARSEDPGAALRSFLADGSERILFAAESAGRREALLDVLKGLDLHPAVVDGWQGFQESADPLCIAVAPVDEGMRLRDPDIAIVPEHLLFGERVRQRRRRKPATPDSLAAIRNLDDLHTGAPVVHEEHGVGRYLGLQKLDVGGAEAEYLTLEYAGGDKLYVPVSSLHKVGRYTGAEPESAPLHRLGSDQWQNVKRKAAEKARDVAAELLDVHARRAARQGVAFTIDDHDYHAFEAAFSFEETPDQETAIADVLRDMAAARPMDRVVCGDVGFGKTEVAMRAAFVAVNNARQVAVLVPTTLLAQQHTQNFRDRFADWPVRIEALSRFTGAKQQKSALEGIASGGVDIVIGTHKLLQKGVEFKRLGLVIVDEEHRFGVRHKERLKALRAEVDLLTLTATPIPRTLNMSLSGLRDLSIIATPPVQRHAIKTFVSQWDNITIREAAQRELKRGGQIYFLHNEVRSIDRTAAQLAELLPDARIEVAHGQMPERDLEQVMLDFYHQRFNVLVCTTIIESGIDVPSANTIVINRADKLGLSQLHQLRGRVGRSHHRAYAYLIAPPKGAMTADAWKRIQAIEALEDLGVGFTLATHDLEIRGAGELLGDEQSGQIHEVGFSLYNDLLDRAVKALRSGEVPDPEAPLDHGSEVDLGVTALLPDDYVPDVHTRLILYKRIAGAENEAALRELQVEMIDRFGLLPEHARNLFETTRLKLRIAHLGIRSVDAGAEGGRLRFDPDPSIDPARLVDLIQQRPGEFRLDGSDRLSFFRDMPGIEERVRAIQELIETLAHKKAA